MKLVATCLLIIIGSSLLGQTRTGGLGGPTTGIRPLVPGYYNFDEVIDINLTDDKIAPWILSQHRAWSRRIINDMEAGKIKVFDLKNRMIESKNVSEYLWERYPYGDTVIGTKTVVFSTLLFRGDSAVINCNPDSSLWFKIPVKNLYETKDSLIKHIHQLGTTKSGEFKLSYRGGMAIALQSELQITFFKVLREMQSTDQLFLYQDSTVDLDSMQAHIKKSEELIYLHTNNFNFNHLYPFITVKIGYKGLSSNNRILGIGPSLNHYLSGIVACYPEYFIHYDKCYQTQAFYLTMVESIINDVVKSALEDE